MKIGNRMLERAEQFVLEDAQRRVSATRAALAAPGTPDCQECGDPIGAKRRKAMPSARTCIDCQRKMERK